MKQTLRYTLLSILVLVAIFGGAQTKPIQKPPPDPVINFRLSLPQASSVIYSIRYSTFLDAKSANELADLLIAQSNDTTLNKPIVPPVQKPNHK